MMNEVHDLKFITPAFLCGADQSHAELRGASVRGQLRWWLRVLGADLETESRIFGSVHGGVAASAIVVRTKILERVREPFERPSPMSNEGYLYYFATVSGERKGIRIEPDAYFAPNTAFRLVINQRHPLKGTDLDLLAKSVECFVRLGTLGLRATRGCGAFSEPGRELDKASFLLWGESLRSEGILVRDPLGKVYETAEEAQRDLGGYLRNLRRDHHLSGKAKTALGFSIGRDGRMASALHLRPVKVKEGFLPLIIYTDVPNSQLSVWDILK